VHQLTAMIQATTEQLTRVGVTESPRPSPVADEGYCSAENIDATANGPCDVLIATGHQQHGERLTEGSRSHQRHVT
jgi:hypothetical protein